VPFFKPLLSIGITIADLSEITEEQRIRVEKKLIAEQRLNQTFSKNDIEQILKVLKEFPDVLKEVARYDCLYGILTGYDAEFIDTLKRYSTVENARMQYVISNYFRDELISYINNNVAANNWNNVRVLLHYKQFLTPEVIKILCVRLEQKIDYALGLIARQPKHSILKKEVGYINSEDFYNTLGVTSNRYFVQPILRILDTITRYKDYTARTVFFKKLLLSLYNYDFYNKALRQAIHSAYLKYGQSNRAAYITWGIIILIVVLFFGLIIRAASRDSDKRVNRWAWASNNPGFGNIGGFYNIDSMREDQKIKMEDFIEARLYSLDYPFTSWKSGRILTYKYMQPFALDIFNNGYEAIRNKTDSIVIRNNTDNECVAIAYFKSTYDSDAKVYKRTDNDMFILYALYIPPGDSINMDFRMELLRFYMGRHLASFNTYKGYIYPDSADLKFAKFTPADSLLLSRGFVFYSPDTPQIKRTVLTISQPNDHSYQISWTGRKALNQYVGFVGAVTNEYLDSATMTKPLLLDVYGKPTRIGEHQLVEKINAFMDY